VLRRRGGAAGALRGERCAYQLPQLYCLAAQPGFWAPGAGEPLANTAQALVAELVSGVSGRRAAALLPALRAGSGVLPGASGSAPGAASLPLVHAAAAAAAGGVQGVSRW
jgi:hypothetical protein